MLHKEHVMLKNAQKIYLFMYLEADEDILVNGCV